MTQMSTSVRARLVAFLAAVFVASSMAPTTAMASGIDAETKAISSKDLKGVSFPDEDHGWVVGLGGEILATTDGGDTWRRQESGITTDLMDVSFPTNQTGWAVGWSDTILRTDDAGETWTPYSTEELDIAQFTAVHFTDEQHGWAVGGLGTVIIATSDGGQTWAPQLVTREFPLRDIHFSDSKHGFAVGNLGAAYMTSDGGATWLPIAPSATDSLTVYTATARDGQNGLIASYQGNIFRTTDGGITWNQTAALEKPLRSVALIGDEALAVGDTGIVSRSIDGGVTWSPVSTGSVYGLARVELRPGGTSFAVGDTGRLVVMSRLKDALPTLGALSVTVEDESCTGIDRRWVRRADATPLSAASADLDGVKGDEVVIGTRDGITALRPFHSSTEAVLWNVPFQTRVVDTTPVQLDADAGSELVVVTSWGNGNRNGVLALDGADGRVIWSADLDEGALLVHPIDIHGDGSHDLAVMGSPDTLYLIDGATGDLILAPIGLTSRLTDIAVGDIDDDGHEEVVVADYDGKVTAVDARSGSTRWVLTTLAGWLRAVEIGDLDNDGKQEVVVAGRGQMGTSSRNGADSALKGEGNGAAGVIAIDGVTGEAKWSSNSSGETFDAMALGDMDGDRGLDIILHERAYAASEISVFDGSGERVADQPTGSGQLLWRRDTTLPRHTHHVDSSETVSVFDGDKDGSPDVFLGLANGGLLAISGTTTEPEIPRGNPGTILLWSTFREDGYTHLSPFIDGEDSYLLTAGTDGLIALRRSASGAIAWRYDAGGTSLFTPIDVEADGVEELGVVRRSGRVLVLDDRGTVLTQKDAFAPSTPLSIATADVSGASTEELLVGSFDGAITGFDALSGNEVWSRDIGTAVSGMAANDEIIVAGSNNALVGFRADTPDPIWSNKIDPTKLNLAVTWVVEDPDSGQFAVATGGDGTVRLIDTNGEVVVSATTERYVTKVIPADLDGDGRNDFVVSAGSTVQAFSHDLVHLWTFFMTEFVKDVAVGDFNGDGKSDVVAGAYDATVTAIEGFTGTEMWTHWYGIAGALTSADMDGDGDDEAIVGIQTPAGSRTTGVVVVQADGSEASTCELRQPVGSMIALDLDDDGHLEPMVGSIFGTIYRLAPAQDRVPKTGPSPTPTPTGSTGSTPSPGPTQTVDPDPGPTSAPSSEPDPGASPSATPSGGPAGPDPSPTSSNKPDPEPIPDPQQSPQQAPPEEPEDTALLFTAASDSEAQFSDPAVVEVRLTDRQGGVRDVHVLLRVAGPNGVRRWDVRTDPAGAARLDFELDLAPGEYEVKATFAGTRSHAAASAKDVFRVLKEDTVLRLERSGRRGQQLIATLADSDSTTTSFLDRSVIRLSARKTLIATLRTDRNGQATTVIPQRYRKGTIKAIFSGDRFFKRSSSTLRRRQVSAQGQTFVCSPTCL